MLSDGGGGIDAGENGRLPRTALWDTRYAEPRIGGNKDCIFSNERAVVARWNFSEQAAQRIHWQVQQWIGCGVVRAQAQAITKDEKNVHNVTP